MSYGEKPSLYFAASQSNYPDNIDDKEEMRKAFDEKRKMLDLEQDQERLKEENLI